MKRSATATLIIAALLNLAVVLAQPRPWTPPQQPRPGPPSPRRTPPPPSPRRMSTSPPPPPSNCNATQLVEETQGPYWVEEDIEATDVRGNLSYGVPLKLILRIVEEGNSSSSSNSTDLAGNGSGKVGDDDGEECVGVGNVRVDLWHCRWDGAYSDEEKEGTTGETWLRGYQFTNSSGYAIFYTIYPGWYISRTVHIHIRFRIYSSDGSVTYNRTTQLYFDDDTSESIFNYVYPYNSRGYSQRRTFNTNDSLFRSSNMLTLVGSYNDTMSYKSTMEFKLPKDSSSLNSHIFDIEKPQSIKDS